MGTLRLTLALSLALAALPAEDTCASERVVRGGLEIAIAPEPAWASPLKPTSYARRTPSGPPVAYAFTDVQFYVTGPGHARYVNVAKTPLDVPGLQDVGTLKVIYSPAYQKLTRHRAALVGVTF